MNIFGCKLCSMAAFLHTSHTFFCFNVLYLVMSYMYHIIYSSCFYLRPQSSKLYPTEAKFVKSSYQNDFIGLKGTRWTPQRYGSASGNRCNNPHPHHTFMVWKFADRLPPLGPTDDISQDVMNYIAKQSFKSTYQSDYHGLPQGECFRLL